VWCVGDRRGLSGDAAAVHTPPPELFTFTSNAKCEPGSLHSFLAAKRPSSALSHLAMFAVPRTFISRTLRGSYTLLTARTRGQDCSRNVHQSIPPPHYFKICSTGPYGTVQHRSAVLRPVNLTKHVQVPVTAPVTVPLLHRLPTYAKGCRALRPTFCICGFVEANDGQNKVRQIGYRPIGAGTLHSPLTMQSIENYQRSTCARILFIF
jgi:hypothetical protein